MKNLIRFSVEELDAGNNIHIPSVGGRVLVTGRNYTLYSSNGTLH